MPFCDVCEHPVGIVREYENDDGDNVEACPACQGLLNDATLERVVDRRETDLLSDEDDSILDVDIPPNFEELTGATPVDTR